MCAEPFCLPFHLRLNFNFSNDVLYLPGRKAAAATRFIRIHVGLFSLYKREQMRCMERSFRTKFYFHLAMKRKRQKERKEGWKMLRCSISNFISWHMSLSHRHTKWDRLNSEMGSRARCAEKKQRSENIGKYIYCNKIQWIRGQQQIPYGCVYIVCVFMDQ